MTIRAIAVLTAAAGVLLIAAASPVVATEEKHLSGPSWKPIWTVGQFPIEIWVEDLSAEAKKAGLTKKMLRSAVELGLRRNEIAIADDSKWGTRFSVTVDARVVGRSRGEIRAVYHVATALDFVADLACHNAETKYFQWAPIRSSRSLWYMTRSQAQKEIPELLLRSADAIGRQAQEGRDAMFEDIVRQARARKDRDQ